MEIARIFRKTLGKHLKSSCDLYIELRRALRVSLTKPQNDHPGCQRFYFSFATSNGVLIEISLKGKKAVWHPGYKMIPSLKRYANWKSLLSSPSFRIQIF